MHAHHGHSHHETGSRIGLAFVLNSLFALLELAGGFWTGSMAVLSDALHDFGDSLFLGSSYLLERFSQKGADKKFTYGYRRFSLFAAVLNGIVLVSGSIFILIESFQRFFEPSAVYAPGMIALAVPGILINAYGAYRVSHGKSMLEKVVSLHLLEDVLGWVVILVAGTVLMFHEIPWLDPVLSIVLISYTFYNAVRVMLKSVYLFLQGVPDNLDMAKIEREIRNIDGIHSVHAHHAWSMDGDTHVMTMHVVLEDAVSAQKTPELREEVKTHLEKYGVKHTTIEMERKDDACFQRKDGT